MAHLFLAAFTLMLTWHPAEMPALDVIEGLIDLRGQIVIAAGRPESSLLRGKCSQQAEAIGQPASRRGAGRY